MSKLNVSSTRISSVVYLSTHVHENTLRHEIHYEDTVTDTSEKYVGGDESYSPVALGFGENHWGMIPVSPCAFVSGENAVGFAMGTAVRLARSPIGVSG